MKKIKRILSVFLVFFKIGLFTFGGGYAMIAVIERELVERKKWITHEEFLDIVAIAETSPGPIAINSATFIGYKVCGFFGSFFATLGVAMPSFIIIFIISLVFDKFLSIKYVEYAFHGIQAAVAFLIISAGIKMLKALKRNAFNIVLTVLTITGMAVTEIFAPNFSTVFFILIGGGIGLFFYLFSLIGKKKAKPLNDTAETVSGAESENAEKESER